MQLKSALLALGLAISAAPLSAQIVPRDPSTRRPTQSGSIGDIIFGSSRADSACRVRDAVTPDGRVVQICDDRRGRKKDRDDDRFEREDDDDDRGDRGDRGQRGANGTRHVNDRDGDGDFDARDRAIRKAEKDRLKAEKKRQKAARKNDD